MAKTVRNIAAEILMLEPDKIDLGMTPDDVETWDSLAHLRLVTAVESEHNIRLSMDQIQGIGCLGDFENLIAPDSP